MKLFKLNLFLILLILLPSQSFASFSSFWGGGGGGNNAGTSSNPIELTVDGATRNNDDPTKYYSFYSSVDQNVTVHITGHSSNHSSHSSYYDLTLSLHNIDSDGSCDTSTLSSHTQDGEFNWKQETNGSKIYCLKVEGHSRYDINLTGDAALKAAISDNSAKESDGTMDFIVALTKATTSDTTINYTFHDGSAINGTNYTGTNGSVTIASGSQSATISVPLIDTNMSTTKEFTLNITSSVAIDPDDASATGTITGSGSVTDNDNYKGPDICYDSRKTSGMCMFGSCLFYKETTNVHSMVNGLSNVDLKKALTRGLAFGDFGDDYGIDDKSHSNGAQAQKEDFVDNDFGGFYSVSMFPKGIDYKLGRDANISTDTGGSLGKDDTTSYYDSAMFKMGLFTQYSSIVTYTKGGVEHQEVLQACNPDNYGSLSPAPTVAGCGLFMDALNSHTKITFNTAAGINQVINQSDNTLNAPDVNDSNNTALCNNSSCQADGVGSSIVDLPTFRESADSSTVKIPYSMVIAQQHVGNLQTSNDSHSDVNRTIVFEAPYSASYTKRVMFIKSIQDHDANSSTHYVFKEGDYWIGSWDINKAKNITIETSGNVRFFIKGDFTIKNTGALNIGHSGASSTPKFYMYVYGNFETDVTGATAIQNGYIYAKGTLKLGSTSTIALDWGSLTSDGELTVENGASSTFNYAPDSSNSDGIFTECSGSGGSTSSNFSTGPFNLIEVNTILNGEDPLDGTDSKNDIYTKVINKDFNISLVHLDDDNITVSNSFNGFVSIDTIDASNNNILQNDVWHHSFVGTIANGSTSGEYQINNLNLNAIGKDVRFKINYIDWDNLLDTTSGLQCTHRSTTAGNLPGVPNCLDAESKLRTVFPIVGASCLDETATGAPCNSNNHGIGKPPYNKKDAGNNKGYGCALCLLGGGENSYSRDNFAIRPYAFRAFGENQYKLAGEDFNITVKGVDEGGNSINSGTVSDVTGVSGYDANLSSLNITSHFYQPSTTDIDKMKADTGESNVTTCPNTGTFTINNSSNLFVNGEVNASLKFSETGILDLNISEKPGHEWALVDADDTNDTQRYIKPATAIFDNSDISKTNLLLFNPYKFDTNATYETTNGKNWIYMNSDINDSATARHMAAYIKYTVTAKNKDGATTQNYTKTCFPDTKVSCPTVNGLKLNTTFDLLLDADLNSSTDANISLYTEGNNWMPTHNQSLNAGNNAIQASIPPKDFENGVGEAKVYFNIDRNASQARNPIKIGVIDANTSTSWMTQADGSYNPGSPKDFNGSDINKTKTFYYGRAHASKQRYEVTGDNQAKNANLYYEIYCYKGDCNTSMLPNPLHLLHTDDIRWYQNTNHNVSNDGNITNVNEKGAARVTASNLNTTTNPSTVDLSYDGSMLYPYQTTMEINASKWLIYNPNGGNLNEFQAEFYKANTSWSGEHETNTTTKVNASQKGGRRINW